MPIALLLEDMMKTLRTGAAKLERWGTMALLEELLIDRARGAFMVHWFGTGIPITGLHIRIAIANLAELRARFSDVLAERNRRTTAGGINLLEPLSGLTGMVLGMSFVPTSMLLLSVAMYQHIKEWFETLSSMITWLSGGLLAPILSIGTAPGMILLIPATLIGAAVALDTNPESLRRIYNLLNAMARAAESLRAFIGVFLSPREDIRNPLMRRIREVLDNVSNVTMALLGAFALLITRIGPRLALLPDQMRAFYALIPTATDIILTLINDLVARLMDLFRGQGAIQNALPLLFSVIGLLSDTFGQLRTFYTHIGDSIVRAFEDSEDRDRNASVEGWRTSIQNDLIFNFTQHRTIQIITALIRTLQVGLPFLKDSSPSEPATGIKKWLIEQISPPQLPDFPDLPVLPDVDDLMRGVPRPPTFSMQEIQRWQQLESQRRTQDYFESTWDIMWHTYNAEHGPSYFLPERIRLRRELGEPPQARIAALYEQEISFRQALEDLFAARAANYLPQLRDTMRLIDKYIYERQTAEHEARLFPTRTVPEVKNVIPHIDELRIHVRHPDEQEANTWSNALASLLRQERQYRVGAHRDAD